MAYFRFTFGLLMIYLWFTYGLLNGLLNGLLMVYLWFTYGLLMVYFSQDVNKWITSL